MGKILAYVATIYALVWTEAVPLTTWIFNRAGVGAIKKADKIGAYKSFTHALDADPLNPRVQLNLGNSFELNEEYDKAASTYEGVLSLLPKDDGLSSTHDYLIKDLVGPTYFNLGNVRAQNKDTPGAARAYQAAFDHGVEAKIVKTNIELLFKGGGGGDGQGQSKSDPKDQKDQKDSKDDQKKDDRTNQQKREDSLKQQDKDKDKGQPKPFQSQELTPEDVKRILDEIKNQEQSIRAQENDKQPKDAARGGKDW